MRRQFIWIAATVLLSNTLKMFGQQGTAKPAVQTPVHVNEPQSQTTTPLTSADADATYTLGPDDSVQVTVWKEPTLSGSLLVRPDGMVTLPLIGDVKASGLTPIGLGRDITTRLKKFISDPLVTVTVLAVNSKRIFLLGEVGRVGPLSITPGLTPLQAIAAAGGLTPYAKAKSVYILRNVNGKQQKISFNYKKAIRDGNEQGVALLPGDTIVVP